MSIPEGLTCCPVCGEYKGRTAPGGAYYDDATVTVLCLCDGIPCPGCGTNRMPRPISERYDRHEHKVLHVSWFAYLGRCTTCARSPGVDGDTSPRPPAGFP